MSASYVEHADTRDDIEIVDDVDALHALANAWSDLGPQRCGPLVSHDWWSCAARAFDVRLHVILVWRDSRLVAVAPLCRVRRRGIERLELIGARELYEPGQFPAVDEQALTSLCRAVAAQGMPVGLERIEAGDPCVAMLAREGAVRVKAGPATLLIPRGIEWREISGSLKNYKYRRRKLEAFGPVAFEMFAPSESEQAPLLDELVEVESRGWKGRNGTSLRQNRELARFVRDFAARRAALGELRISRLTCGGAPAALQLCVEQDGKFWTLKMGYDEKFAAGSPGFVGHVDLMRHAIEARGCGIECLGVAEDWQRQWQMQERRYDAVYFYPNNAAGIAARLMDRLLSAARELRSKRG